MIDNKQNKQSWDFQDLMQMVVEINKIERNGKKKFGKK